MKKSLLSLSLCLSALWLLGCGDPVSPTPTPQQPPVNINICASGSCNTTPAPSTNVPGTNACGAVVSVGVNLPDSISIGAPAQTYKVDTTPRGPGGVPLDPNCTPLPLVNWVTSAECSVSEPSVFNPFLRGVRTGSCAVYSIVGGVKAPTEFVTVLP